MMRAVFINVALVGWPEDSLYTVHIEDGRISAIHEASELHLNGYANETEVVDLRQGGSQRWLSPSMIDWHTHQGLNAQTTHRLDLQSAKSAQEVLERVKAALEDPRYDPKVEYNFVGINMRNGAWPDSERLSRISLDELETFRPIYLFFNGYHSICANSSGLKAGGINPKGHSGYVLEDEAFKLSQKLSSVSVETMDKWIEQEGLKAAALGVTEIVDLEMTHNISAWQRRYANGFRSLRVHAGLYTEQMTDAIELGLKTGDDVPGTNGLIKVGPFKIVTDGSLGSQTAFCHDPYPGTADNYGLFTYPPKKLSELIEWGIALDFKLAIHAIGDEANRKTLRTIASASRKPRPGSTIEHAQLLDFDDLPLFRQLGLIASIQPSHLVDDRELCHKFWPGREHRAYAFRSLVEAGIPIKLGSDCPIAPLQPWEAIAVAISRAGAGDEDDPFCEEQIIPLDIAFAASTSNGKIGLQVGDLADICVIDRNPLKVDAAGLRALQVHGTMLGGTWTFKSL